ncbi:hypothetical protein ACU635_59745 [[Actinomadura] parvosata]|uniref:hypothetical protein n=1 Tax=[Actinomadura] parvosata TaxID=1955412 RepID=UPI00406D2BC7
MTAYLSATPYILPWYDGLALGLLARVAASTLDMFVVVHLTHFEPDPLLTNETTMNRLSTATPLHIQPRTLDFRLRRVQGLVSIDLSSTRGVRGLSTAVTRILAPTCNDPSQNGTGHPAGQRPRHQR